MGTKVIFETKDCVGCRTCELACSYHLKGVFRPTASSIKVVDRQRGLGFAIAIYTQDEDDHLACDHCHGINEPFCVKYCNIIARDELRSLLNKVSKKEGGLV
jgi:Fe-S-cluster-containing hydrogenase component 2